MDGQTDKAKTISLPQRGGDIINKRSFTHNTCLYFIFVNLKAAVLQNILKNHSNIIVVRNKKKLPLFTFLL